MMTFNSFIPVNDYNFRAQVAWRWIALAIPSFSSQSEDTNNAIHHYKRLWLLIMASTVKHDIDHLRKRNNHRHRHWHRAIYFNIFWRNVNRVYTKNSAANNVHNLDHYLPKHRTSLVTGRQKIKIKSYKNYAFN